MKATRNADIFLKNLKRTETTQQKVNQITKPFQGSKSKFNTWNANKNQIPASQRSVSPDSRINLLDTIINSSPFAREAPIHTNSAKEFLSSFADDVLTHDVLRNLLPSSTWKILQKAINDPQHHIDAHTADQVANAMKDWALSKGATHFTHWFHPLSGVTSEKHDSFLTYSRKEEKFIVDFSGKELIKGEPDASSFPNGGIRATSSARGYTIWDMTSPPFIKKGTNGSSLYIPTVFCSWHGEALDTKTPLVRSEEALSREFTRLLQVTGNTSVSSVRSLMGTEQEFFLIDRGYYLSRPDLVTVGRTIVGAPPSKSQENEYHYFGAIDQRILACLQELEQELWKLGIPVKSRHNEVAPSQFEFAPIYEASVIATDHNLLAMEILKEIAAKHGLAALLHEKPFNYVNGSGKHLNWSLETSEKDNLLDPSANPHDNTQFLVILSTILRGLHINGDLLRASIAVPGNTYRLGANEAPPVIISAYLGSDLDSACRAVMEETLPSKVNKDVLQLGISNIPSVARDGSDRNRTSPFAFTGNRFEFRACGSSQNVAFPITIVNSVMADSAKWVANQIEQLTKGKVNATEREEIIRKFVGQQLREHFNVVFHGNGYSEAWVEEAARRGLPLLKTAPEALAVFDRPNSEQLFENLGVLSKVELNSRSAVLHESFFENMVTEANLLVDLITTRIIPASSTYLERLTNTYSNTLAILRDEKLLVNQKKTIAGLSGTLEQLTELVQKLDHQIHEVEVDLKKTDAKAALNKWYGPLMDTMPKIRALSDHLESTIDNSLWPLPKYDDIFLTSK